MEMEAARFRLSRPWWVYLAISGAGILVIAAAEALRLGDVDDRRFALNSAFVLASGIFIVSAALRLIRAGRPVDPRLAWLLATGVSFLFGNGVWWYYQHVAGSQPWPCPSDAGYLAAMVCVGGVVRTYLPSRTDRAALRRLVVDGLLISTGIFLLAWTLYAEQALGQARGASTLALAVTSSYLAVDVVLLTLIALALRHGLARDASLRLLAVALGCYVLGDVSWNIATVHGNYTPGSAPFDVGWLAGYALFTLAPWMPPPRGRADAPLNRINVVSSIGPVGIASAATVALLFFDQDGLGLADLGLLSGVISLTLFRQVLLTRDFLALTRSLEHEVANRTAQLRTSHDQMRHLALHDSLTGLANRRMLIEALDKAASTHPGGGVGYALVLFDLDDFKNVNDTLGHPQGDVLLVEIGKRLQSASRAEDLVVRLGGDEFAVLLQDVDDLSARAMVERMISCLQEPLSLGHSHRILPRASAGLTMLTSDVDATGAMMRADVAMYAAKRGGKNTYAVYDTAMNPAAEGGQPIGDSPEDRKTPASRPASVSAR